jgi:hypothetical protein
MSNVTVRVTVKDANGQDSDVEITRDIHPGAHIPHVIDKIAAEAAHEAWVTRESPLNEVIWTCKIVGQMRGPLPPGADYPLRMAVQSAFRQVTGVEEELNFSGWGGELDSTERRILEGDRKRDA